MSRRREIRASLEIGFPGGQLPEKYLCRRGKESRVVGVMPELPFEDAQFDAVIMHSSAVSRQMVKEVHRVLKSEGEMYFTVPEKTSKQNGYTIADVYSVVRDGFHIVAVERPKWWFFGSGGRTLGIMAVKKNWKQFKRFVREGSLAFSPFRSRS